MVINAKVKIFNAGHCVLFSAKLAQLLIVRCKSDNDSVGKLKGLTPDKSYTVTGIDNIGYRIVDNEFRNYWYTKELFYPIEEERNKKLNDLGI